MISLLVVYLVLIALLCISFKCFIIPYRQIQRYKKAFQQKGYRVYSFPYKPLTYPIIQTIYKDSKNGDAFDTYKKKFVKYDVIVANQLNTPSITLFHPQLRKQFAKAQKQQVYQKYRPIAIQQIRFAGEGLIFSQGSNWKRRRRLMGSLLTFDFIKHNIPAIQQICIKTLNKYQQKQNCKSSQNQFIFDIGQISGNIFSTVIIYLFMGLRAAYQQINGIPIGKFMIDLANDSNMQAKGLLCLLFGVKFLDWGFRKKDRQINARLNLFNNWVSDFVDQQIKNDPKKNTNEEKKTILSIHLGKKSSNQTSQQFQQQYNKQELIVELKNFAIAGTDTSSSFFRMMVYYICKNPKVEQKLREQIKQISMNNPLDLQTLKQFKYVEGIQKQTTRMYGPTNFNFPRKVLKDHYLRGITIKKQTIIQYHSVCSHYNPEFYQNPFQFNPDRWTQKEVENKNPQWLVGFGLGPRNCIGQHLATAQSKIALINFYKRYSRIEIVEKNIQFKWKFLYKPDDFKIKVSV